MRILQVMSYCLVSLLLSLTASAQGNTSKEAFVDSVPVTSAVTDKVNSTNKPPSFAQDATYSPDKSGEIKPLLDKKEQVVTPPALNRDSPEVGKHVMANMNAGSMILSLLMVLALIIICAFILKRFNFTQQSASQLKVVTSLSLGAKERIVVIQAGEQQLLLGVTAQQVTLLERLAEPLGDQTITTAALPKSVLSFFSAKQS